MRGIFILGKDNKHCSYSIRRRSKRGSNNPVGVSTTLSIYRVLLAHLGGYDPQVRLFHSFEVIIKNSN